MAPEHRDSQELLRRIHRIAGRFEEAWRSGMDPRIHDYLSEVDESDRPELLRELSRVEQRLRDECSDRGQSDSEGISKTLEYVEVPDTHPTLIDGPGSLIGDYKLLQLIGQGGMGVVYMAEQERPICRKVALKIIKPGMDSQQVIDRFEAERQALALMDHQNIAKVLDAGTTVHGRPFFVMELVRGIAITKYCDDNRLTLRERLELFVALCQAIQHAHQKGIIHRGIKPSNVLVSNLDGQAVPKVIDFGVAKAVQGPLTDHTIFTQFGHVIGTFEYMSPEQAGLTALDVDTRTDIYSLGVVLYELLTGSTPLTKERIRAAGLEEKLRLVREEEAPKPSTRLSSSGDALPSISAQRRAEPRKLGSLLRGELDWIVMKALEKDRTRRYESAISLARDVERFLANEIVEARPPSTWYRFRKTVRRNRVAFATALSFASLLLSAVFATSWQWWRAEQAAREAIAEATRANRGELKAKAAQDIASTEQKNAEKRLTEVEDLVYASSVQLASSRIEDNQFGGVRELLDQCPQRLRNWEFRNLVLRSDESLLKLQGHTAPVYSASFSPDGRRIVTTSGDHTARIWDSADGKQLFQLTAHQGEVRFAAFSPDGRRVVTASADKSLIVWDATNGRLLVTLKGHTKIVGYAMFGPDGAQIVSSSADRTARLWDSTSGLELASLPHTHAVNSACFSPDGGRIVTSTAGNKAHVWDTVTKDQLFWSPHTGPVAVARFSPDGSSVLPVSRLTDMMRVFDAFTGQIIREQKVEWINDASFSSDGKRIVTSTFDRQVRVWDAESFRMLFELRGLTAWPYSASFSPDGSRIVTASADNNATVWSFSERRSERRLDNRLGQLTMAKFDPSGTRIVTAAFEDMSNASDARVWDWSNGMALLQLGGHAGSVWSAAFDSDGKRIVTASSDRTARVWEASTGRELVRLIGHSAIVLSASFSPDGSKIVTSSYDKTARIWDASTGHEIHRLVGHTDGVRFASFSPNGTRIVTGCSDGTFQTLTSDKAPRVWDVETGRELLQLQGHTNDVTDGSFSHDSARIVTASADSTVRVWDAATGRELQRLLGHNNPVLSAAYSPDDTRIVTASMDNTARIWEAASGRELTHLVGHTRSVQSASFSLDGTRILTAAYDRSARVWLDGSPVRPYEPDGSTLSQSRDNFQGCSAPIAVICDALKSEIPKLSPMNLELNWRIVISKNSNDLPLVDAARAHLRINQPEEAASVCDRLIELNPQYLPAYVVRGIARARQGKSEAVDHDLIAAEKLTDRAGWLKLMRSVTDAWRGNFETAEAHARTFQLDNPNERYNAARVWSLISEAARHKNRENNKYVDLAIDNLRQVIQSGFNDFAYIADDTDLDPIRLHPEFAWLIWENDENGLAWNTRIDFRRKSNATLELLKRKDFATLTADEPTRKLVERLLRSELKAKSRSENHTERKALAIAGLARCRFQEDWHSLLKGVETSFQPFCVEALVALDVSPQSLVEQYRQADQNVVKLVLLETLHQCNSQALSFNETTQLVDELKRQMSSPETPPELRSMTLAVLRKLGVDITRSNQAVNDNIASIADRNWYSTPQGLTMLVMRPITPSMLPAGNASSNIKPEGNNCYRFAITDCEVTIDQFRQFNDTFQLGLDPNLPATRVTASEAARYCNWLSEKAGLPENQWCYAVNSVSTSLPAELVVLKPEFLDLAGYRLPTSSEWRYACGESVANPEIQTLPKRMLAKYAWSMANSGGALHPVAELLPNRRGLFDALGNAEEWCETDPLTTTNRERYQRELWFLTGLKGGSYWLPEQNLTSHYFRAERDYLKSPSVGFRVCASIASAGEKPSATAFWKQSFDGVSGEVLQAIIDTRRDLGLPFCPTAITSKVVDDNAIYDVTLTRDRGSDWRLEHGMNDGQYAFKNNNWEKEGYKLEQHATSVLNGKTIHAAIWTKPGIRF